MVSFNHFEACGVCHQPVCGCPQPEPEPFTGSWTLNLNRYQRDNLLWLLNACGYPHGNPSVAPPFTSANTGDWIGEVTQMLAHPGKSPVIGPNDHPNQDTDHLREAAERWKAEK